MKYLSIIAVFGFFLGASELSAQTWTSYRNAFGGEDVYLGQQPSYSTRRNVFGGRDLLTPDHRYVDPYSPPQYQYYNPYGQGFYQDNQLRDSRPLGAFD